VFFFLQRAKLTRWEKLQKNSLKECVSALKLQCHNVKNTLLQNAFSAILPTGNCFFHFSGDNLLRRLREVIKDTPPSMNTSISTPISIVDEDETMKLKIKIHGLLQRYVVSKVGFIFSYCFSPRVF